MDTENKSPSSEEKYKLLFNNMQSGFTYCKILCDEQNNPIDFIYLQVNEPFKILTNLKGIDVIGKRVSEVVADRKILKQDLIDLYGRVALSGQEEQIDVYIERLQKWLSIFVYSPKHEHFVALVHDITIRKTAEQSLVNNFEKLQNILENIVNVLASTVELKDPFTAGHQERVTFLASAIAKEMGLSRERINATRIASSIHDIGKISVPSEILAKPSGLTDSEMKIVMEHPQAGYNILKKIDFSWPIAQIVLEHHERIDGSGYPKGIKGEDICLEAKIIGVADVVEAMAAARPHRPAKQLSKAIEEIKQNRGILYDPDVVDVCFDLLTKKKFKFN